MDIKGLGSPAIKSYWWKAHKLKNPGWKQNWNEPKHKTRNEERQDKVRCWAVASAARLKLKNIYIFILTCERVLKGEKYKWQIRATGQESVWSSSWWAELHKLTELNQHIHSHCILKLHFGSPLVQFILIQLQRSNQHPFQHSGFSVSEEDVKQEFMVGKIYTAKPQWKCMCHTREHELDS